MTTFHRTLVAAAVACAALVPAVSHAGDFLVRARVLRLEPANQNTADKVISADSVTVSTKTILEVDASYFLTPNFALELIATNPQKHEVRDDKDGVGRLGTLRHLPPTLSAQYHFAPTNPTVRPYVGFGVNYTHFSAVNLNDYAPLDVKKNSWGTSVQLGADFPITKELSINVDFKKIDIRTDVTLKADGSKVGTVKVDPVLFGIGIGYSF